MTAGGLVMLFWVVLISVKGALWPFLRVDPMLLSMATLWIAIESTGTLLLWGHLLVLSQGALSIGPMPHWLFSLYCLALLQSARKFVNVQSIPVAIGVVLGVEVLTALAGGLQHLLFGGAFAAPPFSVAEIVLNGALAYPVVGLLRASDYWVRRGLKLAEPATLRL